MKTPMLVGEIIGKRFPISRRDNTRLIDVEGEIIAVVNHNGDVLEPHTDRRWCLVAMNTGGYRVYYAIMAPYGDHYYFEGAPFPEGVHDRLGSIFTLEQVRAGFRYLYDEAVKLGTLIADDNSPTDAAEECLVRASTS